MAARFSALTLLLTLLVSTGSASAAPPAFDGRITGIEVASQEMVGAAVFVFEYEGLVDGKIRRGLGWIAVNHQPLQEVLGGQSLILGGTGEIVVGLKRFDIEVNGGLLTNIDPGDPNVFDDVFSVQLSVNIRNPQGQRAEHTFEGVLSHETLIPTIAGDLSPGGP
jgi:hypothetical protein